MGRICCVCVSIKADDSHIFCRKVDKKREKAGKNRDFVISVARDCHFIHEYPILEANVGAVR